MPHGLLLFALSGACTPAPPGGGDCPEVAWYYDGDQDGYGVGSGIVQCEAPSGYTDVDGDCHDGDAGIHPDATETWYDGVDQDCDGNDTDADGDLYPGAEAGGADCDDQDPTINPDAEDICGSGIDEDCDGEYPSCGFDEVMSAGDADIVIQRSTEEPGAWFGDPLFNAGDSDGDGRPEIATTYIYGGDEDDGDSERSAYILLQPPEDRPVAPDDILHPDDITIGRWILSDDRYWGREPPAPIVSDHDIDGDGFNDYFFATATGTDYADYRVDLWHGPPDSDNDMVLDEGADTVMNPPWSPDLNVAIRPAIHFIEQTGSDTDWQLVVSLYEAYHLDRDAPAFALLEPRHFEGTADWDDTITIWDSRSTAAYASSGNMAVADFDGDGVQDVATDSDTANPHDFPMRISVLQGPLEDGDNLADAPVNIDASVAGAPSNRVVQALPDADGDGRPSLAIRLDTPDGAGIYVFQFDLDAPADLAPTDAYTAVVEDDDYLPYSSTIDAGDIDGDGVDELAIGVEELATNGGQGVVILDRPTAGTIPLSDHDTLIRVDEPLDVDYNPSSSLGRSLLGRIDANHDGYPDLVLSEPYWDGATDSYSRIGRISIFHGRPYGY